jgi:NAD(P)-dependent dehydrogenase (short-subunit alcohol dehydrogenase family)
MNTVTANLLGAVHCIQAVVPSMIKARKGKMINIAGGGEGAFPRFSAYACSKSALVRLTETVAKELEEYGIQVNAIAPGGVNTSLLDQVLAAGQEAGIYYEKAKRQKASGGVPADKTDRLAVFLASGYSRGITGRLFSAVWDDWEKLDVQRVVGSALYQVRRIDGVRFLESNKGT